MSKYEVLAAAIDEALEIGRAAELKDKAEHGNSNNHDWGLCNFYSPMIRLAGWRQASIEKAFATKGISGYKKDDFFGQKGWWVIFPRTESQGEPRVVNAQVTAGALRNKFGYEETSVLCVED